MANARSTRSKDPRCVLLRGHGFSVLCAWLLVGLFGCESSTSEPAVELKPTDRAYLEALVAEQILTLPSKIDKYTELTGVSVIPSGLRYKLRMIHMPAHTVDHGTLKTTRVNITQKSCTDDKERFELEAGGGSRSPLCCLWYGRLTGGQIFRLRCSLSVSVAELWHCGGCSS